MSTNTCVKAEAVRLFRQLTPFQRWVVLNLVKEMAEANQAA